MSTVKPKINISKDKIFELFQNLTGLDSLFTNGCKTKTFGTYEFTLVSHDMTPIYDQEKENAFVVWKVGDLYVKLEGYIGSYGNTMLQRWYFVTPKEKVVQVYE